MRSTLCALLCAAMALHGQSSFPPLTGGGATITSYTVATLPGSATTATLAVATDASTAGSCSSGGGSALSLCRWSGASWITVGGSGGSGTVVNTYTVATLPVAPSANTIAFVTDAAPAGSCTVGSGTGRSVCQYSGSAWVPVGAVIDGAQITSGTVPAARLPAALSASTSVNGTPIPASTTLVPTTTTVNGHALSANVTVSATDVSTGTLPAAQLPNPSASTLGGIQSKDCTGTGHVLAISTSGVPSCSADSGGGAGTPGGSSGQIQYNNAGSFGGRAAQGTGSLVQMASGSPGSAGAILVYDSNGNAIAAACTVSGGVLTCGSGTSSHGITFPELNANGANSFSIYGADSQSADACIILPSSGQPTNGQVIQATSSTATTTDGNTCVITQWATLSGGGTVTSVQVALSSLPFLALSGTNPITSTGTVTLGAATGLTQNQVLATPNGSSGAVALRSLVSADMPALTGGDATSSAGSGVLTLNTVNVNTGSCGDATHVCQVSHDGKGRATSATPILITGGGGGSTSSNPYISTFTCSASPTTITAATHGQGVFPFIRFRDANNKLTAADKTTLASNGDLQISCGSTISLTAFISGAVGSMGNGSSVFTSGTAVTIPQDQHGFSSTLLDIQTWDNSTPRILMSPDTTSVDAGTFQITLNFATAQAGLAVVAYK